MDRLLKAARASGSLNLSNRSLRDVPEEIYRSLDAVGEGEKWWEAVELQKLILAHNNIESLKEEVRNLPLLTVLNVSHNKLTDLPAAIGQLSMLKLLDVSFNSIVTIPEEIGSATSLVKFDCSSNRIKELPSSLGKCSDLSDLKVSNNLITSLPEDLTNCSKLTKLDVEGNKLTALSENLFASCTMLTELNASKNLLSGIPENIGCLTRLIRLDLHQNSENFINPTINIGLLFSSGILYGVIFLSTSYKRCLISYLKVLYFFIFIWYLPPQIFRNNALSILTEELGALSRLGTLDLHSNQLKEYPVGACKLSLSVLDLSNNSLTGLPAELGKMTTLRKLLLSGNPLRTLRSSLVSGPTPALLRYLRSRLSEAEGSGAKTPAKEEVVTMAARLSLTSKELSLEGMGLSVVPSEAWESGEIIKLNLSKNSIQELPVELSSCSSLQTLVLSRNNIKDWPIAILKSLPNLSCLKLDSNPLRQIPSDGFQAISMIQILDISGNATSLPENPAFSNLPHLKELYLRRMQLREVPSEIMSLRQLQILGLSQNSLQSIPEGFKNLTSLTELDLSDNNISTLPPELGLLEPSLQVLRLDGNPLRRYTAFELWLIPKLKTL
ncbi:plant intracellular Ras-group-related LRR protein 6-like [Gossypium australe]|uniref:Plant intracellular Ras-group-related LRR protein 6-like n=1 Tax=Gossypium australe TaxID=47621 RepID=A0A5B6WXP5_9ROSI|nr:plant intracellular Ras-group-related LRR protein 6-like [Gossypium australe]